MSNPVIDFILSRASVPIALLGEPAPTDADIELIVRAAVRVPDHGKLTPWRFILYRGDVRHEVGERLAALAEKLNGPLDEQQREKERTRLSRAPLVVAVVSSPKPSDKIPEWEQFLSAGAAAMTLVNAANALGYSTNWVTNWYADDAAGRQLLGLAPQERLAGMIHIGSYDGTPAERPRPEPASVMSDYSGPWEDA